MSFTRQLASVVAVAVFSSAQADIINVDVTNCPGPGDGSELNPYCSIQTAIDNAVETDEIIVAPGTYRELINFQGKKITLRSSDGAEVTIINGDINDDGIGDGSVVTCFSGESALTVLDGFTITRGRSAVGGGMHNAGGSPTVTNCVFRLNRATAPDSGSGGGMFNDNNGPISNPTVTNCRFEMNFASIGGGGMTNFRGHPTVIGCSFINNTAATGAGMFNWSDSTTTVTNCTFIDNTDGGVVGDGGGMFNDFSPTVTNCIFARNSVCGVGGGMGNAAGAAPTVTNCTFSKNTADSGGRAISGPGTFVNCILWGDGLTLGSDEIDGAPTVIYSDVQGGFAGMGNISLNPMLIDPDNDDFHISAGSPCIDAGNNWGVAPDFVDLDSDNDTAELTPWDLDGNPRFADDPATTDTGCFSPGVVDMGAYEFPGTLAGPFRLGDIDGDGEIGINEFLFVIGNWGPCDPGCCIADFDLDGEVGIFEFLFVLGNWG